MVKVKLNNGEKDYFFEFDEERVIRENELSGEYEEFVQENLRELPYKRSENSLSNYGELSWYASGTTFGEVRAGAVILYDSDTNDTQGGPHFRAQGMVWSNNHKYELPDGEAHKIPYLGSPLNITFYDKEGNPSGTKIINI